MKLNLYDALQQPSKIIEALNEADIATLALVLSYISADLSYINKIRPFIKGAFDYSVNVPKDLSNEIIANLFQELKKKPIQEEDLGLLLKIQTLAREVQS